MFFGTWMGSPAHKIYKYKNHEKGKANPYPKQYYPISFVFVLHTANFEKKIVNSEY